MTRPEDKQEMLTHNERNKLDHLLLLGFFFFFLGPSRMVVGKQLKRCIPVTY